MKPLRNRIIAALDEIERAADAAEKDFARDFPDGAHHTIQAVHKRRMDGLRDVWRILSDFGAAPDDFEAFLKLQKAKPKEFAAFMLWVKEEIERPAPAEQQVAA